MVRYLVGEGTDRPSLTEAINAASDGDTIELESVYCPTVDKDNVNKSLNFIGHVTKKEEGGKRTKRQFQLRARTRTNYRSS